MAALALRGYAGFASVPAGAVHSTAKSGVNPALSRNGDVPEGNEPGRL